MESAPVLDLTNIPDQDLQPQIQGLVGQYVSILRDVEGIYAGLDQAAFNWKPAGGQWSIGECIDHLNLVNAGYVESFRKAIDKGRREKITGMGPFSYGFIGRWLLRTMEPPVRRRVPSPRSFQPRSNLDKDAVVREFERQMMEMIESAKTANGLDLAKLKAGVPGREFIRFPVGVLFLIVAAHCRRHLWQARNVRNQKSFPVPAL